MLDDEGCVWNRKFVFLLGVFMYEFEKVLYNVWKIFSILIVSLWTNEWTRDRLFFRVRSQRRMSCFCFRWRFDLNRNLSSWNGQRQRTRNYIYFTHRRIWFGNFRNARNAEFFMAVEVFLFFFCLGILLLGGGGGLSSLKFGAFSR